MTHEVSQGDGEKKQRNFVFHALKNLSSSVLIGNIDIDLSPNFHEALLVAASLMWYVGDVHACIVTVLFENELLEE